MTFRNYIITAFDGVTLHNTSTLKAVDRVQEVSRALTQIITLPDGTKYDSTPSTDVAPLVPGAVSGEIIIAEATRAASQTTFGTIAAKLGVRGTLTVKELDSATTYTATVRMTAVRNLTPIQSPTVVGYLHIFVAFELLTNFA